MINRYLGTVFVLLCTIILFAVAVMGCEKEGGAEKAGSQRFIKKGGGLNIE